MKRGMRATALARLCVLVSLAVGLTGCHSGGVTFETTKWPESLEDLRFRWSAEPGINLLSGPAVPLRAYLESHRIGDMTRNTDLVYPG